MRKGFIWRLLWRLFLTLLFIFALFGTIAAGLACYVLNSPSALVREIDKQDAPEKVHDNISAYFEESYHTTAIPAEVFMDVITEDWVTEKMHQLVEDEYQHLLERTYTGYTFRDTALEESIISFFEAYAESIGQKQDAVYNEKLQTTIDNANAQVLSRLDVYHFSTLRNAGMLQKVSAILRVLPVGFCGILAISAILMVLLILAEARAKEWGWAYFPGCAFAIVGAFLAGGSIYLLATRYFDGFAIKMPAVYAVVTGLLYDGMKVLSVGGIGLLVIGLLCMVFSHMGRRLCANTEAIAAKAERMAREAAEALEQKKDTAKK